MRTPFDIVSNALFLTMGLTQSVLPKNICLYKYAHNLGPKGSPDMIPTAFDVKFHETKHEIPPRACRPLKKLKKNNVDKVDPQKVEKKQCRTSESQKVEKTQCRESGSYMLIYLHYTFIYLHIPPNSFIYLHIPPHTSKY